MQKSTKHITLKVSSKCAFLLIELAVAFALTILGVSLLTSFYRLCDHTHNSIVTYFEKVAVLQNALRAHIWQADPPTAIEGFTLKEEMPGDEYAQLGPQLPSFVAYMPRIQWFKGDLAWHDKAEARHALSFIVGRPA